jgi:aerobic-type carbon monoxide dehydrogenase small subunit (CoxS/CutS family)
MEEQYKMFPIIETALFFIHTLTPGYPVCVTPDPSLSGVPVIRMAGTIKRLAHYSDTESEIIMENVKKLSRKALNINGVQRFVHYNAEKDNLAVVLRRLGLTGTKVGCGTGVCGACSVLLDGKVTRSCVIKMKNVDEFSEVLTIEGIGTPQHSASPAAGRITYGGVQCGFCSPGFIVSSYGLLLKTVSHPTGGRDWF